MLLLFIIAAWDWLMTFERKRRGKKLPTTNIKATQSLKSFSCLFLKKPNTITYNHTLPKMTIADGRTDDELVDRSFRPFERSIVYCSSIWPFMHIHILLVVVLSFVWYNDISSSHTYDRWSVNRSIAYRETRRHNDVIQIWVGRCFVGFFCREY